MNKRLWGLAEKWLTLKIGVEMRCCLTFFLMLFYYCVYRLLGGVHQAEILHIAGMIAAAYLFGWVQALLRADFDQIDRLGLRQWAVLIGSGIVYGLTAFLCGWFGGSGTATVLFAVYMVCCGLCTVWICSIKRAIDAKLLNDDLHAFQQRNSGVGEE